MLLSRRRFLRAAGLTAGGVAARFSPAPLWAQATKAQPCLLHPSAAPSPFAEGFVHLIAPGNDGFVTEKYAAQLESILEHWCAALRRGSGEFATLPGSLAAELDAFSIDKPQIKTLRSSAAIDTQIVAYGMPARMSGSREFLSTILSTLTECPRA